mmetsp:Transcript_6219/g.7003  ORF Transcript_6219/g.7003 Transcript_6219/m.7003 type:complete len:220 (-) Transcript_6219:356-1015(-)
MFLEGGYINSGQYQLPVFKGAPAPELIEQFNELAETEEETLDPWEVVAAVMDEKKSGIKYLNNMTVVIRLLDGQREGHLNRLYHVNSFDYTYLPEEKLNKFAYNSTTEAEFPRAKKLNAIFKSDAGKASDGLLHFAKEVRIVIFCDGAVSILEKIAQRFIGIWRRFYSCPDSIRKTFDKSAFTDKVLLLRFTFHVIIPMSTPGTQTIYVISFTLYSLTH